MTTITRKPKVASPYTVERCRSIVEFIAGRFSDMIPRACFNLYSELARSVDQPTDKLVTWLNIIANLLKGPDGKMVMDEKKAVTIEFVIGG